MAEAMMERIARAIMKADGCGLTVGERHVFCDDRTVPPDMRRDVGMCQCKYLARAAVEAMREPTHEMLVAGGTDWTDGEPNTENRHIWSGMIDALLTEGGRTPGAEG